MSHGYEHSWKTLYSMVDLYDSSLVLFWFVHLLIVLNFRIVLLLHLYVLKTLLCFTILLRLLIFLKLLIHFFKLIRQFAYLLILYYTLFCLFCLCNISFTCSFALFFFSMSHSIPSFIGWFCFYFLNCFFVILLQKLIKIPFIYATIITKLFS